MAENDQQPYQIRNPLNLAPDANWSDLIGTLREIEHDILNSCLGVLEDDDADIIGKAFALYRYAILMQYTGPDSIVNANQDPLTQVQPIDPNSAAKFVGTIWHMAHPQSESARIVRNKGLLAECQYHYRLMAEISNARHRSK